MEEKKSDLQITYPKVHFNDQDFDLKYPLGAYIRLGTQYNLELKDVFQNVEGSVLGLRVAQMLSVGISHAAAIDALKIADQIQVSELPYYIGLITEALKKATPQTEPVNKPVVQ